MTDRPLLLSSPTWPGPPARDAIDLRDPLLLAMMRATRTRTPAEQTLHDVVLKMRLLDAGKR